MTLEHDQLEEIIELNEKVERLTAEARMWFEWANNGCLMAADGKPSITYYDRLRSIK